MGKEFQVKPTSVDKKSPFVNPSVVPDREIIFSFRHLTEKDSKFEYKNLNVDYFLKLIDRIKNISLWTKKDFVNCRSKSLRAHPIGFIKHSVSECSLGIMSPDADANAWQFGVSSNEYGRVHGYFIDNVFYVVWLDKKHELYSNNYPF